MTLRLLFHNEKYLAISSTINVKAVHVGAVAWSRDSSEQSLNADLLLGSLRLENATVGNKLYTLLVRKLSESQ